MTTFYNEEHGRIASAKIVTVAQNILSGELGIVAGARQLAALRFDVGADRDSDFLFFVGVDSETDHLPLGDARSHWNPDALKAKDEEWRTFEAFERNRALEICQSLIQKYGTHDA